MKNKSKYYDISNIMKCDGRYRVIYGGRSYGKTAQLLMLGINEKDLECIDEFEYKLLIRLLISVSLNILLNRCQNEK